LSGYEGRFALRREAPSVGVRAAFALQDERREEVLDGGIGRHRNQMPAGRAVHADD
jgi:hypothetical protein